jgi:hypothetical protein
MLVSMVPPGELFNRLFRIFPTTTTLPPALIVRLGDSRKEGVRKPYETTLSDLKERVSG